MLHGSTTPVVSTIGIDLGDQRSVAITLDEHGGEIEETKFMTTEAGFRARFLGLPPSRIAIEAGTHSPWVSRLLASLGHEVIVANPRMLRLVYQNTKKDDRVDARYLARLARVDPKLLSPIEHRGAEAQADRALLRARDALVRARTLLSNQVRGVVKSFGSRLPSCSVAALPNVSLDSVPDAVKPAIEPILEAIANLTKKIRSFDKHIDDLVTKRYQVATVLTQVAGVGNLTALAFLLTIEDPSRFSSSRRVGSYLGLCPRKSESGLSSPELRISKSGDGYLRRLLVQSAQYILGPFGPDTDLRRWGLLLAARGKKNAKKRAVIAVARKLAVLLHRLWVTRKPYIPLRGHGEAATPVARGTCASPAGSDRALTQEGTGGATPPKVDAQSPPVPAAEPAPEARGVDRGSADPHAPRGLRLKTELRRKSPRGRRSS